MMTAREAMQQAIERAQLGDFQGGHLWLGIATELRQGTLPVAMSGQGKGYEDEPAVVVRTQNGPISAQGYIKRAMRRAPSEADYGTTLAGDPAYGHDVPTETVVGIGPDGYPALGQRFVAGRAETQVMQRIAEESTPAYDEAGQSLGDTRSIPHRIAHPKADAVGPNSTCLTPECGLAVIWIRGRGWVHDTPSHTASCDKAAEEAPGGDQPR